MKIKIEDMCFNYGSKETLRNITFEINRGKIVGILGQNGCGKTTLLKCIDRMIKPHSGSILLEEPDERIFDSLEDGKIPESVDVRDLSFKELAREIGRAHV